MRRSLHGDEMDELLATGSMVMQSVKHLVTSLRDHSLHHVIYTNIKK